MMRSVEHLSLRVSGPSGMAQHLQTSEELLHARERRRHKCRRLWMRLAPARQPQLPQLLRLPLPQEHQVARCAQRLRVKAREAQAGGAPVLSLVVRAVADAALQR